MSSESWKRIEALFFDALERAPDERASFLERACAGDAGLRAEVEAMLAAHEDSARLRVESRLIGAERPDDDAGAMIGERVGAYRIVRLIGRGGMGNVFLAERDDAHYERQVAIKLMRPGFRAAEMAERFRQERQILAHLEHPHIAALLDGGVTDDGHPYLVMQYVDGLPITDYCEAHGLSVRGRLALFRTVCEAVQAAHVNLIVHRDLKPANILVTDAGEVKLLDFGIAKLIEPEPDLSTTHPLDRVMTPAHAAPEQVRGEPVTTATDVYALGVLLYELLTGERPLRFPTSSAAEIERVICEVEPAIPSAVARRRRGELRGDLDNIVLMALRKDPARRYQSARELEDDVGRHLRGLPVRAAPDTLAYRARKFVARHRVGVAVAALFGVVLVGFLATTAVQSRRLARERDRARAEQAKADEVVQVLVNLFERSNPFVVPGGDTLRVSDFIAQGEEAIADMGDTPAVQARMWEVLGWIHAARSNLDRSYALFERALEIYERDGDGAIDAARVRHILAQLTAQRVGADAAEPLLRESLERHRMLLGPSHKDVAVAMRDLAAVIQHAHPEEAESLLSDALAIDQANLSPDDEAIAADHNALGFYYANRNEYAKARPHFERALEILRVNNPDDHPNVMTVSHNLASIYGGLGDWEAAESMHRELLDVRRRVLGERSVEVAGTLEALGNALTHQGRFAEAASNFEASLDIFEEVYGGDHDRVRSAARNLGVALALDGRPAEGLPYLDRALEMSHTRALWSGDALIRSQRAASLYMVGRVDEALAEGRVAIAEADSLAASADDPYRAYVRGLHASMLIDHGETREADPLLREAIEIRSQRVSEDHRDIALASCLLAAALGDDPVARELLRKHHAAARASKNLYPFQRALIDRALAEAGIPES